MVSQVKRETMRECLSCPLCDSILLDATTIFECLHTFCRKCIYEKITEDEIESCPVCNIDLGGTPLDKLRPDHNLQDLRAKIFPLKRMKVKAQKPARRKERLMSSLTVTTPKALTRAGATGRRTQTATRKELPDNGSLAERTVEKEESLKGTSSPGTLNKSTQNIKQVNKDSDEPWDDELYWKTLNLLVEVAKGTNTLKSCASQGGPGSKSEQASASHKRIQPKVKDKKSKCRRAYEKSDNGGDHTTSETRLPRTQRKRPSSTTFGDSRNAIQPDESSAKQERRNVHVWFSLVASTDQEGKTSLPQIPAKFLRIRDRDIPVSFIQKYLMRKLDLQNETGVEIRCMGEAVIPTLKLQKLVDLWLQRSSKRQWVDASIGSSAEDYMMVLVYGRKLPKCNN